MSTPTAGLLQSVFERLAQTYDWQLVEDSAAFLTEVAAEFAVLDPDQATNIRAENAVLRTYSARLHQGLIQREERAAHEILQTMRRLVRRDRFSPDEAEDVAQEAVAAVIDGLDEKLRSPKTLLKWQFWIYRDVRKRWLKPAVQTLTLTTDQQDELQLADATDLAQATETRLVGRALLDLLDRYLDEPYRTVLLRIVILDERPRHVARALGLSEAQARQYKFRALKRLREIEEVRTFLRGLVDEPGVDVGGATDS